MIKWLFKWLFRLVVLVILLLVILVLSIDSIARSLIEQRIRARTGMDARIGRLSVGLLTPEITAENVKVYNSAEFGGMPFLDLPEVHLEYDRLALFQRKFHLTLLRVNLAEADIVKGDKGRTNITVLKATSRNTRPGTPAFKFGGIDVLNLSIGKVRYVDLRNPAQGREQVFGIKNQVHRNLKTTGDVYGLLLLLWLQNGGGFSSLDDYPISPGS